MCGILFVTRTSSREEDGLQSGWQRLVDVNASRGPDAQTTHSTSIGENQPIHLDFFASELMLRGGSPIVQPHREGDDVLCWNGEIFEGMEIAPHENDGAKLFQCLRSLETTANLPDLFGSLEGPYAFVYYHGDSGKLFFARDPLGRRSLLVHRPSPTKPYLILASASAGVDPAYEFEELSTDYIYSLNLKSLIASSNLSESFKSFLHEIPRQGTNSSFACPSKVNRTLPADGHVPSVVSLDVIPADFRQPVDDLVAELDRSVKLQVQNIPPTTDGKARVGVLFSGGIDSTMLAFLANSHAPPGEAIDLLNVAFENPRKLVLEAEGNPGGFTRRDRKLWKREVAVTPVVERAQTIATSYLVPDRVTGLEELEELRRLCPHRKWNFVEVNVTFEESQAARTTVEALMLPGKTVMDLSLAIALYFAARGIGQKRDTPEAHPQPYTSTARVLLNGLGSDELLGGYGRHRTAFKHGGFAAIVDEMQLEIDRIPIRNLGRDDRVISAHGKEARHPFLSLSVVALLAQMPVHIKADPRLEPGLGDKLLLRLAARKVGLVEASSRKKRAMQFGSRSARMEGGEGEKRGTNELNCIEH